MGTDAINNFWKVFREISFKGELKEGLSEEDTVAFNNSLDEIFSQFVEKRAKFESKELFDEALDGALLCIKKIKRERAIEKKIVIPRYKDTRMD